MNKPPIETKCEDKACTTLRQSGCVVLKGKQDNSNDWPDRLVLCPDQHFFWIEFKRIGEGPRPSQRTKFRELQRSGHHVYICRTMADVFDCMIMEGLGV